LARKSAKKARAKYAPVLLGNYGEARLLECALVSLGFCHGTQVGGCCPRNGIGKVARPGSRHVVDPKGRAGPQHARPDAGWIVGAQAASKRRRSRCCPTP
jgi:hypothetical protein